MIDLHNGDCLEVMKTFEDNCIDLTITSPPYDTMRTYNGYIFDFEGIAQQLYRITKHGGVVVWVVGDETIDGSESGTSFKQALYFKEIGFKLHDTMIYEKANFSMPQKNRYHQIFEYMFVFSKGKPKTFNPIIDRKNKWVGHTCLGKNTVRLKNGEMQEISKGEPVKEFGKRFNIWRMNTVGQENMCKKLPHPAMFPERLANDHIISWSNEGETVLDCFMGSGTTGIACKKLNRKFVGIEISDEYFNIAQQRINETVIDNVEKSYIKKKFLNK